MIASELACVGMCPLHLSALELKTLQTSEDPLHAVIRMYTYYVDLEDLFS